MKPIVSSILKKVEEAGFKDILEPSEDDIRTICGNFCFDLDDLGKRLRLNNHATQLMTAHLAFDHTLSVFLSQQFVSHATINVDRLAYGQKVDLLYSMGLIDELLLKSLRQINTLRNKAAHQLDFKVSPKDVDTIIGYCPKKAGVIKGRRRFAEALLIILLGLDGARSYDAFRQVMTYRAMINARRVLEDVKQSTA